MEPLITAFAAVASLLGSKTIGYAQKTSGIPHAGIPPVMIACVVVALLLPLRESQKGTDTK